MKDLIRHLVLVVDIVLIRIDRSNSIVLFLSIYGNAGIILDQVQIVRIQLFIGITSPLLFTLLLLATRISGALFGIVFFGF